MIISVFGLGYVGSVLMGCLPELGHEVIGIDIKPDKVESINDGTAPVFERELESRIDKYHSDGKIRAVSDTEDAVMNSELALVCVGTPANLDGSINLDYVTKAVEKIGAALVSRSEYFVVAVRSTVLPGTTGNLLVPLLEKTSKKKSGEDFGVCMNPEFLREGHAVFDFFNPARIIIGESDEKAGELMESMYKGVDAPVVHVPIKYAEMIKYIDNSYHGLKIAFANEIGTVCNRLGLNSSEVMKLFYMDNKLNISTHYLKPGFAFGGLCIPKDLNALVHQSKQLDVDLPLLEGVLASNATHIERALEVIQGLDRNRVGILGLTFKENTNDIRESPMVKLINRIFEKSYMRLYDKQYTISIWEPNINAAELTQVLPHFTQMLSNSMDDVVKSSEIIVIGNSNDEFKPLNKIVTRDHIVLDLVKLFDKNELPDCTYLSIS